jgi:uncharacterized protein (TIGR02145 family)
LLTFILLSFPIFVLPQTLNINKNDGTVQNYDIGEIDSITFTTTNFDCGDIIHYGGKIYETVLIGNQCWMKKNLDIGIRIDGGLNQRGNAIIEKYCYDDIDSNCSVNGGLYQWNEAMGYLILEGAKGICPGGWHIPSESEFKTLKTAINNNGNTLKALGQGTGDGTGTDSTGFSALMTGYYNVEGGFQSLISETYSWSSTETDEDGATRLGLKDNNNKFGLGHNDKVRGYSVRCIKD